jgi:hypothetical protein
MSLVQRDVGGAAERLGWHVYDLCA